jgi:hypothetical protein
MSQENPAVEHITEDGSGQDITEESTDTRTDEEILAEGNKDDEPGEGVDEKLSSDTDVDEVRGFRRGQGS